MNPFPYTFTLHNVGASHTMALSKEGRVFIWGDQTAENLGIPHGPFHEFMEPQEILQLADKKIKQVCTFLLSHYLCFPTLSSTISLTLSPTLSLTPLTTISPTLFLCVARSRPDVYTRPPATTRCSLTRTTTCSCCRRSANRLKFPPPDSC